jgi:hypothetical protein
VFNSMPEPSTSTPVSSPCDDPKGRLTLSSNADLAGRNSGCMLNRQRTRRPRSGILMGPAIEAKAPNFSPPKHCLNAEQPSLSAGSIVYRFPLFHSSYEMRGIVMNASRVGI